jgi:hypothetical protein
MMQNFEVYQLKLNNDSEEDLFNVKFCPTAELIVNAKNKYQKVAVIQAENFDHVFEISNLGEEEHLITRLSPMHSVSVGDVLVNEAGKAVFVDNYGFGNVQFN